MVEIRPRTLFCIGRNYAEHALELGNAVPSEPVVFLKPVSALIADGGTILLPPQSTRVDHELEVVVALGRGGRVHAYAIGIDVTARDLQEVAKKKSLPWAVAKGFDTFAPVGPFIPASDIPDPAKIEFELKVNGELRQKGHTGQMLFSIERLIDHLSGIFTLAEGDLIFTGTPPGVGPLVAGDRLEARILGTAARLSVSVQAARGRGRR